MGDLPRFGFDTEEDLENWAVLVRGKRIAPPTTEDKKAAPQSHPTRRVSAGMRNPRYANSSPTPAARDRNTKTAFSTSV